MQEYSRSFIADQDDEQEAVSTVGAFLLEFWVAYRQLTNPADSRENKEVASPQHVGLWRSLGARFHGMEEVVGSIPTRSTKLNQ